jgi:hypothetical protein
VRGREALGGAPGSDGTVGPADDGSGEPWRRRSGLRPPELAAAAWRRQRMAGDDGRRCRRVQRPSGREERDQGARGRKRAPTVRQWSVAAACSVSELRKKRWRGSVSLQQAVVRAMESRARHTERARPAGALHARDVQRSMADAGVCRGRTRGMLVQRANVRSAGQLESGRGFVATLGPPRRYLGICTPKLSVRGTWPTRWTRRSGAQERERADTVCRFNSVCDTLTQTNSRFSNASRLSPKTKVVEQV